MFPNRSMPSSTLIPVLGYPDVNQAADWLCAAFGFSVRMRIRDHRVQLNVGDGCVVVTRGSSAASDGVSIMVRIPDVAAHHAQAKKHGAHVTQAPQEFPYGEKQYTVEDLAGHVWTFSQSIADIAPEDWGGTSVAL
jgi:uncharacterized glyoxalase superfamily protein PhnB